MRPVRSSHSASQRRFAVRASALGFRIIQVAASPGVSAAGGAESGNRWRGKEIKDMGTEASKGLQKCGRKLKGRGNELKDFMK